jgi:hypothetical protein
MKVCCAAKGVSSCKTEGGGELQLTATFAQFQRLSWAVFHGLGGRPGRNRTCNPRIRNPMLYPLELRAQLIYQ